MRKLNAPDFQAAEYQRAEFIAHPEAGITIEEMKDPGYWANVAWMLKPYYRVEARAKDGTWWAELLVRAVQPFAAKVHVLRYIEFDKAAGETAIEAPRGYEFHHRGKNGWHVMRLADRVVLTEKVEPPMQTKADAALWLDRHLKAIAG